MTARIFISYSSKDSEIAEFIHEELTKRGADVFIDYRSIDDGDDFFERIAREVEERDRVLFLVSKHSVNSKWVKIELQHAFENDKPITPIALDDTAIPRPLFFVGKLQRRAFERSAEYLSRLCKVLGVTEEKKDTSPAPAVDPSPNSERGASKSDPSSPDPFSHAGGEKGDSVPDSVRTPLFEPRIRRRSSLELMPQPFAWIDIPGTIGKTWTGEPYKIAKYPVTNAQYKVFMEAGGYKQPKWWTEQGWQYRLKENLIKPRYWGVQGFSGAEQPVVGVSWFEAVAFCLWLSDTTGEKVSLPSEGQWQYAAQGDDKREYSWGNEWQDGYCNSSVNNMGIGKTTPVRQFEGKGDSPFGVIDMTGNMWEWCMTDVAGNVTDVNVSSPYRALRGGSWNNADPAILRSNFRNRLNPDDTHSIRGFRCACSF